MSTAYGGCPVRSFTTEISSTPAAAASFRLGELPATREGRKLAEVQTEFRFVGLAHRIVPKTCNSHVQRLASSSLQAVPAHDHERNPQITEISNQVHARTHFCTQDRGRTYISTRLLLDMRGNCITTIQVHIHEPTMTPLYSTRLLSTTSL